MKQKINKYFTHQHSCFLLEYVLIIPFKTGLDTNKQALIYTYTKKYFKERNIKLSKCLIKDIFLRIEFLGTPTLELTKLINAYKSATSRLINKDLVKVPFWSSSYLLLSKNTNNDDVINNYISNIKE